MGGLRYDIEADWYLLDTCNFRCEYCFLPAATLGKKLSAHAEPARWRDAFDATGLTWLLHMTGGEPSLYPGFADLAAALTERHTISFNSNMTGTGLASFAERIDPRRVSFINAGLHFTERRKRRAEEQFLRAVGMFHDRGFPIIVTVVATPEVLERADDVMAMLRPLGIAAWPKLLRGMYLGKSYPHAYSDLERQRFRTWTQAARDVGGPPLPDVPEMDGKPTVNVFSDERFVNGLPRYTGRMCHAGSRFVSIRRNGDVQRCSKKLRLGNILDGTFSLLPGPAPCDTAYCFYFCEKYSEPAAARPPRGTAPTLAIREPESPRPLPLG